MEDIIHTPVKVESKDLELLYDLCNELFINKKECFFTNDEIEELRENKSKIFLQ